MPGKPKQTLGNILAYPNALPRTQRAPKSGSRIKIWHLEATLNARQMAWNIFFCIFLNFFHFFATSGPGNLWKLLSTWKCLPVDIFSTIFGDLEQILGLKLPHPTIGMAWKIILLPFFKFLLLFGFQMTKYGAEYIHRKVFSCAELFSQVSRSTGCQKVEEIWKNAKNCFFNHSNGWIWEFQGLNLFQITKYGTGRHFHVLSCFHRFPGPLVAKKWKKF